MNSQLYTAASGLIAQARKLDMVANNLANVSTNGYRAQRTFQNVYQRHVGSPGNRAVALAGSWEPAGAGVHAPTGNPLDVALGDGQLLVLQTPAGRRYSRDGALSIGSGGELVDAKGNAVLDPRGVPITGLDAGSEILADGRVMRDGNEVATLQIARYDPELHQRVGGNLLSAAGREDDVDVVEDPQLRPGHVEQSNAAAVEELVRLIEIKRAFETYQKLVSLTMNDVNRRAVNDIAK